MRRLFVISIVGLAGAASMLAGRWAFAQGMVNTGNALDANPMYGSGGNNARTARRTGMQSSIYTTQDGRMQYNEANAFAQPRYVPVGREGQVQASAMAYNSAPRNPNLASQSGYGAPRDPGAGGGTYRDYTTKAPSSAFQTPAYTPTRTSSSVDPSISYRIPAPAGEPYAERTYRATPTTSAGEALDASAAAGAAADGGRGVKDQRYRVSGVRYGQE